MNVWLIVLIVVIVFGLILSNVLLLKQSKGFNIPKNFKKKPDHDEDESGFL